MCPPPPDDGLYDGLDGPPPPPPDDPPPPPPPPPAAPPPPDFSDAEGQALWKIMELINEELLESDEDVKLTAADVKDIQASVMQGVFGAMSTEGRYTLIDADRAYLKSRVRYPC